MSNSSKFKEIPGSICAPHGFKAAAVFCDIKKLGTGKGSEKGRKHDLALIISDVPAAVAGMFTTNQVCAPPVKVSVTRAKQEFVRAIVVNSGNANACTGKQGMRDAETMTRLTADAVAAVYDRRSQLGSALIERRYRKVSARDVLVCSTGRIGVPMPMKNVGRGIRDCASLIARSASNARDVAEAIMTSDTRRKEIAVEFKIDHVNVRLGGISKGAGMIQPRMAVARSAATALSRREGTPRPAFAAALRRGKRSGAATGHATMLAFITSDIAIKSKLLKAALEQAVRQSFNRITVDGDMSTNDSVIVLANGLAGNRVIRTADLRLRIFQEALNFVCLELAKMMVRDGEGVSRFITLRVANARTAYDAELAARAIANSSLVKTSWCGGDPNWGRILCAVGYSGAAVDESVVDIGYSRAGEQRIAYGFRAGRPSKTSWHTLTGITSRAEFEVHVDLHLGSHDFVLYASDLTEDYVSFNKGDIKDPSSLGG
jgi:glutamate N-acetyltransferase/amino-acid N-acetyltransferase